jgi:hypothetical protein
VFLILDHQETGFGRLLESSATKKGIKTMYLTSKDIIHDILLDYRLTDQDEKFLIRAGNIEFCSGEIFGAYCGLNNFWPELWPGFSAADAQYAAQETYALWLAMISSLSCRVINKPAMDTLAGSLLSVTETLFLGHKHGLDIPLTLILESGQAASALLSDHSTVQYTDLGNKPWATGRQDNKPGSSYEQNANHCRITEVVSGKLIFVAHVGDKFFLCSKNGGEMPVPNDILIPDKVYAGLRGLQKVLNLNMAEYYFRIGADQSWIFSGYGRVPEQSVKAYGTEIIDYIVKYAIGNGGS